MVKKIIGVVIFAIIIIFSATWTYLYIFVPPGKEWDIKYNNLERVGLEGHAEAEKAELTKHGLYTRSNFVQAGDAIEYTFDVINDGTIDAKLKIKPINLKLDYYLKKHVKYIFTYKDGTEVKKGDILKAGETKSFKVQIIYENAADIATMDSQFYESNIYLMYLQKRF